MTFISFFRNCRKKKVRIFNQKYAVNHQLISDQLNLVFQWRIWLNATCQGIMFFLCRSFKMISKVISAVVLALVGFRRPLLVLYNLSLTFLLEDFMIMLIIEGLLNKHNRHKLTIQNKKKQCPFYSQQRTDFLANTFVASLDHTRCLLAIKDSMT